MSKGTLLGANYKPLSDLDCKKIHAGALELLEVVGMGNPTPFVRNMALAAGCKMSDAGRLCFPKALVEDLLNKAAKHFNVHGRSEEFDFEARNGKVNLCTGGAAVQMLDLETREYRPSLLKDLYDLARVADHLENIQWFARPVVATDVAAQFELDVNTIYACAAGTNKHIATSIVQGDHVPRLLPLLDALAGGEGKFVQRPFCTVHATTLFLP